MELGLRVFQGPLMLRQTHLGGPVAIKQAAKEPKIRPPLVGHILGLLELADFAVFFVILVEAQNV